MPELKTTRYASIFNAEVVEALSRYNPENKS